ncbi:hypothetical protein BKA70DRAFT_1120824 [Coprinopsis sp. MPI-PUGE-AT-0042]|nr:hypothetical protein BKA70DRAFT_1120824 [Coprinopsis sp. MPI-PUGE-AT-0042]
MPFIFSRSGTPGSRSTSNASAFSRSGSLAPGDSVSQVPSPRPLQHEVRTAERPDHLVPEVLWHIKDCAHDPQVQPSLANGNSSRPCIKKDVRALYNAHLHQLPCTKLPLPGRPSKKTETRCMTWYKSYHRATWDNVVHQLETMHEILQLCAGHWKAEHMISAHLHSLSLVERSRARGAGNKSSKSSSGRDGGKEKGKGHAKGSGAADSDAEASTEEVDEADTNSKTQDGPSTAEGSGNLLRLVKATPHFPLTPSSPAFNAFVARIECADPNDPSIDEDETNQSWGHQQFTRNGNLDSAAPSWEAVGNVEAACKQSLNIYQGESGSIHQQSPRRHCCAESMLFHACFELMICSYLTGT